MLKCRACGNGVSAFMSFGQQPIANHFIAREEIGSEYFFQMDVGVCSKCTLFQLIEQPDPGMMFHENYTFFSQTSKGMQVHFEGYANFVKQNYLENADPFVVEIGSNDGIMLRHFAGAGIRHLGIEPSGNVAAKAREAGVDTVSVFFGPDTAADIAAQRGRADAILAANVMCHIPDLNGVARGAAALLKPAGVLIFEDPYLGDVLEKTSYDQIYDEHVFVFSAMSVRNAFAPHGFELIDCIPQSTHGGSMRYVLAHRGARVVSTSVAERIRWEEERGLEKPETFTAFARACETSRQNLITLLQDLKDKGKKVAGYAATSKSTTILNYCKIGPDLISFISDTTPQKQGKLSPGMHIPVLPYSEFVSRAPDYSVLFAWNHRKEIMANETDYMARGGRWIRFVPDVAVE
jgi:methylation protein EvaC